MKFPRPMPGQFVMLTVRGQAEGPFRVLDREGRTPDHLVLQSSSHAFEHYWDEFDGSVTIVGTDIEEPRLPEWDDAWIYEITTTEGFAYSYGFRVIHDDTGDDCADNWALFNIGGVVDFVSASDIAKFEL